MPGDTQTTAAATANAAPAANQAAGAVNTSATQAAPAVAATAASAAGEPNQPSILDTAAPLTLKAPQGADAARVAAFAEQAKKLGLKAEQAQALLDAQHAEQSAAAKAEQESWQKETQQWATAAKADPEIGGAKFDASVKAANAALAKFAAPELRTLLQETGFANHPEVVRLLARVGAAMREGGHVSASQPAAAPSTAQALFPSMPNP